MTRRRLRILQTSDVHLGPRSREPNGLLHHDECICPIEVLGHLAHEHAVDVVMIVGDLFEHARVSHQLVEIALLPGNHDVYDDTNVYRRQRDSVDTSGVRFFDDPEGRSHDFAGGALRIWARAMDDHSPKFSPLGAAPAHPGDRWYVAAAHGHFVESTADDAHRSSRITPADIDATDADYVALGHWHVTTDLSTRGVTTPAWYSGAPMFGYGAGRMLLVDLVPGEVPLVRPLDVLDHPASRCAAVTAV